MTKVKTNRGTSQIQVDVCPTKFGGVLFQKCQTESLASLPQSTMLSVRRGTGVLRVSDYPKVDVNTPNWGFVITCRGTGVRKL